MCVVFLHIIAFIKQLVICHALACRQLRSTSEARPFEDGASFRVLGEQPLYSREPDGAYLTAKLTGLLDEVPAAEARAGDLALFRIRENPQHLAILTDYEGGLGMIHSFAPSRRVVEHRLDDEWKSKIIKVFRWQQSF